jgi:hypothetical protein
VTAWNNANVFNSNSESDQYFDWSKMIIPQNLQPSSPFVWDIVLDQHCTLVSGAVMFKMRTKLWMFEALFIFFLTIPSASGLEIVPWWKKVISSFA